MVDLLAGKEFLHVSSESAAPQDVEKEIDRRISEDEFVTNVEKQHKVCVDAGVALVIDGLNEKETNVHRRREHQQGTAHKEEHSHQLDFRLRFSGC